MLGLAIICASVVYLIFSLLVIKLTRNWARRTNRSPAKWGWIAALAMYLVVFWDWIPTIALHQYYCDTEAGFWVYKTVDQWKKENPGVMETLVANKSAPPSRQGDTNNYTDTYSLNQRINRVVKQNGPLPINRWRHEQLLIDAKTNQMLARYVDFSASQERQQAGWNGWKFWLGRRNCSDGGSHYGQFLLFKRLFQGE